MKLKFIKQKRDLAMIKSNKKATSRQSAAKFLPSSLDSKKILIDRASNLAQIHNNENVSNNLISYIRFRLGLKEYYGIPYNMVTEVMHRIVPTKLPNTPLYIAGIINRRGKLLTIIDLRKFFELEPKNEIENQYIIVAKQNHTTVGILVDNIESSRMYEPTSLDAALTSSGSIKSDYIIGIHDGDTTIINISAIIAEFGKEASQIPQGVTTNL